MLVEEYPGICDGAIANGSTSAVATENMDSAVSGPTIGHCTFTPDASFFPAAKGFNPGFRPDPWIF
jgi:hypothetical protein